MKTTTLTETKNRLGALIERVRHGETILILDRGRPIARIEPVAPAEVSGTGRLDRLERAGLVRRGRKARRPVLRGAPPAPRKGASVLRALLDERREGR